MNFFKSYFQKKRPIIKANNFNNPFNFKFQLGVDCDEIPNSYGDFGKSPTNPIPVNGPDGEAIYFNSLRTISKKPMLFHRLSSTIKIGSEEAIDVFEVVSIDGKSWDILYFDMYHPRNSNKFPTGYIFCEFDKLFSTIPFSLGITNFLPSFPENMEAELKQFPKPFNSISGSYLKFTKDVIFIRPQEHFLKVIHVNNIGNSFDNLINFIAFNYSTDYFINLLLTNDLFGIIAGLMALKKIPLELVKPSINYICVYVSSVMLIVN